MKTLSLILSTSSIFVAALLATPAYAQHAGAQTHLGMPDFERTVEPGGEATLSHLKSPAKQTVCASRHDSDPAKIKYDNHEVIVGPGDCTLIEASYVTASSGGDSRVHVFGWHKSDLTDTPQ